MSSTIGAHIQGRYRIVRELARGGMGAVFVVDDESTGVQLALKRLLPEAQARPLVVTLFRREYHTLAQLQHPNIIRVHDYGVDDGGAFYTMELLDGHDLRQAPMPMPYVEACKILRDVASALALLHSRRLLHRDLSRGNVRITGDGTAKLFDFGAMASFGVPPNLAGTPSATPPEAIARAPLDQRADLYALGALAYRMLTGDHAYPALDMADLPAVWRAEPPAPSEHHPDVPSRLDVLVMGLLSRDPLARPTSAAEVIEELNAIAKLDDRTDAIAARSFLLGAELTGREHEMLCLREALDRAGDQRGGACLVRGKTGTGKRRLLHELSIVAMLGGFAVVHVDARDITTQDGLLRRIVDRVFEVAPDIAREVAHPDLAAILAFSGVRARLGGFGTDIHPTAQHKIRTIIRRWLIAVADRRPLLISVEDIQAADDTSASQLAGLCREAGSHALLLVFSQNTDESPRARRAMHVLGDTVMRLELSELSLAQTARMIRRIFGDAPDCDRLVEHVYELSGGNPLTIMEWLRQRVDEGVIAYQGGMWLLPQRLPEAKATGYAVSEAMAARAASLGTRARHVAAVLSLHAGPIGLPLIVTLSGPLGSSSFSIVDELVSGDILVQSGSEYRFRHRALRGALVAGIAHTELASLHRELGDAKAHSAPGDAAAEFVAGHHMMLGGEGERGAATLLAAARQLDGTQAWPASSIEALERALDYLESHAAPERDCLYLRVCLLKLGFFRGGAVIDRHGDETVRRLAKLAGLTGAERLSPVLGRRASLALGVAGATARRLIKGPRDNQPSVRESISELFEAVLPVLAGRAACIDIPGIESIVRTLEPLSALPEDHPTQVIALYARQRLAQARGRWTAAGELARDLLAHPALEQDDGGLFPSDFRAALLHAAGLVEALRDPVTGLSWADRIEGVDGGISRALALHVRIAAHNVQGATQRSERLLDEFESLVHQGQAGSYLEIATLHTMLLGHAFVGDTLGVRRAQRQLEQHSEDHPQVSAIIDRAKGLRLLLNTGDRDQVLSAFQPCLRAEYRSFDWALLRGFVAMFLNSVGDHKAAKTLCDHTLTALEPGDRELPFVSAPLVIQAALAEAALGRHAAARSGLTELSAIPLVRKSDLILGRIFMALAMVERAAGDQAAFERAVRRVQEAYGRTRNPLLTREAAALATVGDTRVSLVPNAPGHSVRPSQLPDSLDNDLDTLVE